MLGKPPSRRIHQPLRVDEPYTFTGLLYRKPLQSEEAHQLHRNSNACGARAEEKDAMSCHRATRGGRRELCGIEETTEHHCAGTLDIVIEQRVFLPEALEIKECLFSREVLQAMTSEHPKSVDDPEG